MVPEKAHGDTGRYQEQSLTQEAHNWYQNAHILTIALRTSFSARDHPIR